MDSQPQHGNCCALSSTTLTRIQKNISEPLYLTDDEHRIYWEKKALEKDISKTIPARLVRERHHQTYIKLGFAIPGDLFGLCKRYQEAKCENPRDKVNGLLGVSGNCCSEAVHVDYARSKYDLCSMVLQHHFLTHVYDEGQPEPSPQHHSILMIRSAQVFHQAMGVSYID